MGCLWFWGDFGLPVSWSSGLCSLLLENLLGMSCPALKLVGPCVVLGFSAGMEAFDEFLSINVPWSQELPGVRVWTSILLQNVSTLRARTFSCSSTYSHCLPSFIQSTWITGTCSQLLSNAGQLGQVETTGPKTEPAWTS